MWKVILGVLLAMVDIAPPPIPSKVFTVTRSDNLDTTGSIVVSGAAPSDSKLFSDEQEVLASINTANFNIYLCQLGMNTILTRHK